VAAYRVSRGWVKEEYFSFQDSKEPNRVISSGQGVIKELESFFGQVEKSFAEGLIPGFVADSEARLKYLVRADGKPREESRKLPHEKAGSENVVILMDEPTTSLDYRADKRFTEMVRSFSGRYPNRVQFYIATHESRIIDLAGTNCINFYKDPVTVTDGCVFD